MPHAMVLSLALASAFRSLQDQNRRETRGDDHFNLLLGDPLVVVFHFAPISAALHPFHVAVVAAPAEGHRDDCGHAGCRKGRPSGSLREYRGGSEEEEDEGGEHDDWWH
jgi:hypothetical protein